MMEFIEPAQESPLQLLQRVVVQDLLRITKAIADGDERDLQIVVRLRAMSRRPLTTFVEAYNGFMREVKANADIYNRWVYLQIRVLTALGDSEDALMELHKKMVSIFSQTPDGDIANIDVPAGEARSFYVALAFQVYGDVLTHEQDD